MRVVEAGLQPSIDLSKQKMLGSRWAMSPDSLTMRACHWYSAVVDLTYLLDDLNVISDKGGIPGSGYG